MPFSFKNTEKAVAVFLLIGLFMFLAILVLIGRGSDLFKLRDSYYTMFNDGYGLGSGMSIKYKGIQIGKIQGVSLYNNDKIKVDVEIFSEYKKLIKQGCVLNAQQGILGAAILELFPSSDSNAPELKPGNQILSSDMEEGRYILDRFNEQAPKKDDLTAKAKEILDYVASLKPVIDSTMMNIRDSTGSIRLILEGLRGREKTEISDKILVALENINITTKNIRDFSAEITSSSNSIGSIAMDNRNIYNKIDSILTSLDASLKSVQTITGKLKDSPEDIKAISLLLKDNLIEMKKVLTGLKNIVGGEKATEKSIRSGDRN